MPKASRKQDLQTLGDDLAALRKDLKRLSRDVAELAEQTARDGAEDLMDIAEARAGEARGFLDQANRVTRDVLQSLGSRSAGSFAEGRHELEAAVERNPFTALGVAAAVGFSLAMMMRGGGQQKGRPRKGK
jgi:ElaB/YqjD/DUF883 family membrane-anchored ribosome-binding protein